MSQEAANLEKTEEEYRLLHLTMALQKAMFEVDSDLPEDEIREAVQSMRSRTLDALSAALGEFNPRFVGQWQRVVQFPSCPDQNLLGIDAYENVYDAVVREVREETG